MFKIYNFFRHFTAKNLFIVCLKRHQSPKWTACAGRGKKDAP